MEIEDVDLEWQKDNGTPRGFSMGRVCPNYLATQVMFGACSTISWSHL
ncbi:hypothetical protein [Planktotalea sp.]|nr:hypothetical protein [Planktotalea sp.]